MAQKFVNGWREMIMYLLNLDGSQYAKILFSFYYEGLKEYDEDIYIEKLLENGRIEQKYRFTNKEFVIDYSGLIFKSDALLLQRIYDGEKINKIIQIQPNGENEMRIFTVVSVKEQRELARYPGQADSFGNTYGPVRFKTSVPVYQGDWIDPDILHTAEEAESVCI